MSRKKFVFFGKRKGHYNPPLVRIRCLGRIVYGNREWRHYRLEEILRYMAGKGEAGVASLCVGFFYWFCVLSAGILVEVEKNELRLRQLKIIPLVVGQYFTIISLTGSFRQLKIKGFADA